MRFDFDSYDGKYVMHCSTEEQAEIFCQYLDRIGKTWSGVNHRRYSEVNHYNVYEDQTCYRFAYGTYCNLEFYKEDGSIIVLEFSDFEWDGIPAVCESEISFEEMFYGAVNDNQNTI